MGKSAIILLLIAVSVTSCGKKKSKKSSVAAYQKQSSHPVKLKQLYNNCPRVMAQSTNKEFNLDLVIDGYNQTKSLDFSDLLVGKKLKSKNKITSTTSKYEDMTTYRAWWNSIYEKWDVDSTPLSNSIITNEKDVEICPGYTDYTGSSFESAALSITYSIKKTNEAVLAAVPDLSISPVEIKVAPLYGKKIIAKENGKNYIYTMYDTDNAFYKPWDQTIHFLPQSEEGLEQGVFGNKPLWQIPMVASHEYGHHLFSMIYPKYSEYYSKGAHTHENCFDSSGNPLHNHSQNVEGQSIFRSPNEVDNIRSLNEGFADLVSFYSLDNDERGLYNITCMEVSRDVDSSIFADGSPKVFSSNVKNIFYSYTQEESDGNCETPNYQDIHLTGAIFAHATDEVLSMFTTDKTLKLKTVLNWLKKMNIEHDKIKSAYMNSQFEIAFSLLVKTALEDFGRVETKEVCEKVRSYFPKAPEYNSKYYLKNCYKL